MCLVENVSVAATGNNRNTEVTIEVIKCKPFEKCVDANTEIGGQKYGYTHYVQLKLLSDKNVRAWDQWISHKMYNRHPLQLKKSKSWEPLGSYQLNSTADWANLAQI